MDPDPLAQFAVGFSKTAPPRPLTTRFFASPTLEVARALVGVVLGYGDAAGIIVETEAYTDDPASHFVTRRKAAGPIMGETFGRVYVYRIYGMHHCLNFTTDREGPGAVLVRALEPLHGLGAMRDRRGTDDLAELMNGPGKLCQALGIDRSIHGRAATDLFRFERSSPTVDVTTSPRIGIRRGVELPWRFVLAGSRFASRPRAPGRLPKK